VINTKNLKRFITVNAHCSMTHQKQQKIMTVGVIEVIYRRNQMIFAVVDESLNNGP